MANPRPTPPRNRAATQFKPGIDWKGNPGGRPAGESFTSLLRQALESDHKTDPSWRHRLVAQAIQRAAEGDLDALKWIAEKTEGKVKDEARVEHGGKIDVEVTYSRRAHQPGSAGAPPGPDADP